MEDPFGPIKGISDQLPIRSRERAFLQLDDASPAARSSSSFVGFLQTALRDVAVAEGNAEEKIQGLASGKTPEIHEIMVAMSKSEVAFNMLLEVRNKLVDAWREISHISL